MNRLSIIVLNYNDADTTLEYMDLIKDYKIIDHIIVVDNASSDNSFERLLPLSQLDRIDVIASDKNGGYAYGNNYGIRYVNQTYGESEYILISNPDISVSEDTIAYCLDFLDAHENAAIVAPRMRDINGNFHPLSGWKQRSIRGDYRESNTIIWGYNEYKRVEEYDQSEYENTDALKVDCVAGSFFFARNSIFKEIGYFDEGTFLYFEEDIIGSKLGKLGYDNYILTNKEFTHYESVSVSKTFKIYKRQRLLLKSRLYYFKTCIPSYNWFKGLAFHIDMFFRPFYEKIGMHHFAYKLKMKYFPNIRKWFEKHNEKPLIYLLKVWKLMLTFIVYITLPIFKLVKHGRKGNEIVYIGPSSPDISQERMYSIPVELQKYSENKVTYMYETYFNKYMEDRIDSVEHRLSSSDVEVKKLKIRPVKTNFQNFKNLARNMWRTTFMTCDTLIFTHPEQLNYIFTRTLKAHNTTMYYDVAEDYVSFANDANVYMVAEDLLIKYCKHVFVGSENLKDKIVKQYTLDPNKLSVIRNGYSDENSHIENIIDEENELVYIGRVDQSLDIKYLTHLAQQFPDKQILLCGPVQDEVREDLKGISNLTLQEVEDFKEAIELLKQSRTMLLPYKENSVYDYSYPTYIYEYLYYGKTVVARNSTAVNEFKDFILVYDNKEQFVKQIEEAKNYSLNKTPEYDRLMKESTWTNRISKMNEILERK